MPRKPFISPNEKSLFKSLEKQHKKRMENEIKFWSDQNRNEIDEIKTIVDFPISDKTIYYCSRTNSKYNYLYYKYDPHRFE